jgi:hypothetical protein
MKRFVHRLLGCWCPSRWFIWSVFLWCALQGNAASDSSLTLVLDVPDLSLLDGKVQPLTCLGVVAALLPDDFG